MNANTAKSSLHTRIKSALVFAPVVLFLLYMGGSAFTLMMSAATVIAVNEWAKMVLTNKDVPKFFVLGLSGLAAVPVLLTSVMFSPVVGLMFAIVLSACAFAYSFLNNIPSSRLISFGFVYIVFSICIMVWLRAGGSVHGLYNIGTLLFVVWGSDVFAYIAGRSFGGKKLAPKISPKKTWSGFAGAAGGAAVIAAVLATPMVTNVLDVDTIGNMSFLGYALMGGILGMVGQGGDLLISFFKRKFGIKDTGTLIPGHGGILDRIDALLLGAYVFGAIAMVMG